MALFSLTMFLNDRVYLEPKSSEKSLFVFGYFFLFYLVRIAHGSARRVELFL